MHVLAEVWAMVDINGFHVKFAYFYKLASITIMT